jgi:hypothetical protein
VKTHSVAAPATPAADAQVQARARRIAAAGFVVVALGIGAAATGAFWFAGRLQHGVDLEMCSPKLDGVHQRSPAVDLCIAEREARRYGPFKALGDGDPPGIED